MLKGLNGKLKLKKLCIVFRIVHFLFSFLNIPCNFLQEIGPELTIHPLSESSIHDAKLVNWTVIIDTCTKIIRRRKIVHKTDILTNISVLCYNISEYQGQRTLVFYFYPLYNVSFISFLVFRHFCRQISRSAHQTPNFTSPEYFVCLLFEYFSKIKVLN